MVRCLSCRCSFYGVRICAYNVVHGVKARFFHGLFEDLTDLFKICQWKDRKKIYWIDSKNENIFLYNTKLLVLESK